MKKQHIALVVLAALAVGGVAGRLIAPRSAPTAGTAPTQPAAPAAGPAAAPAPRQIEDARAVYRVPLDDSPVRGPSDALVTIVESSDLECPFCRRAAPTLKQVEEAYRGKVRFAFRHNPLSMHPNAVPAAIIAEEARAQGGDELFWAAHDRLLEAPKLDRETIERVGKELGIAESKVKAAIDGFRHLDRLRRDQNLMTSLGARGTPTFFVNGRKLVGAQPLEAFKAVIDEELARAEALVTSGVARKDVYAKAIERGAAAPVMVAAAAPGPRPAVSVPIRADDPARGAASARVTVVEFSDFQCPFCARALPAVKELEQAYGKEVRVVWKHLPLSFHPNAMPAAIAAEAAREQGKFWEMHDKLFASQQTLSDATYRQYAKELGLDLARFGRALAAPATRQRVEEDARAAAAAGVTGTPSFVVNGEVVLGSSGLRAAVDRELAGAQVAKR